MKETLIYKTIPLKGSQDGSFTFAIIEEPYGAETPAVVSVCAHLSDAQQWVLHIPMEQVKEVRKALKQSKSAFKTLKKNKKQKEKKVKASGATTKETKTTKANGADSKKPQEKQEKKAN